MCLCTVYEQYTRRWEERIGLPGAGVEMVWTTMWVLEPEPRFSTRANGAISPASRFSKILNYIALFRKQPSGESDHNPVWEPRGLSSVLLCSSPPGVSPSHFLLLVKQNRSVMGDPSETTRHGCKPYKVFISKLATTLGVWEPSVASSLSQDETQKPCSRLTHFS